MHLRTLTLISASIIALTACHGNAPCSPDAARQKADELTRVLQATAAADPAKLPTWHPERLAQVAPLARDLVAKAAAQGDDLPETCAAIDGLMAEFRN